jgi:predicted dithiol-disulfide oxidoreductase (DUF899 family)
MSRSHDRLRSAERRRMPMIRVEKDYRCTAPCTWGGWHDMCDRTI